MEANKMKKCPKNVEKVHNFLDLLPPRRIKTIWIWGKMMFDDDKLYQTDTSGLFLSYISHVCTKCCLYLTNITPIWRTIRDIFQSFEFENNLKIRTPHTSQNSLYFELWTFRFSALTPTPLLDFFHIFGTFLILIASLSLKISLKHHKKIVSPPYLMFYACFFYLQLLSITIDCYRPKISLSLSLSLSV